MERGELVRGGNGEREKEKERLLVHEKLVYGNCI